MDVNILCMAGEHFDWGLHGSQVMRVLPESEWKGPTPTDLDSLFGIANPMASDRTRVLVVRTISGEGAIKVKGDLYLRSVPRESILSLPSSVIRNGDLLGGVVLEENQTMPVKALLIVNPEGLQ